MHIEYHNEKAGFFGFFESSNTQEVASALLNKVSQILGQHGMEIMRGPMSFSTDEECGSLIEGFNSSPMLMTPCNPPYYNQLIERYGMKKAKDLYAYIIDSPEELPKKVHRVADIASKSGISVRPIDKKNFNSEMRISQEVYNSAWAKNWGFIPLTDEETVFLGNNLKPVVVAEMTVVAEKSGEPVGFMGLLPDFNYAR